MYTVWFYFMLFYFVFSQKLHKKERHTRWQMGHSNDLGDWQSHPKWSHHRNVDNKVYQLDHIGRLSHYLWDKINYTCGSLIQNKLQRLHDVESWSMRQTVIEYGHDWGRNPPRRSAGPNQTDITLIPSVLQVLLYFSRAKLNKRGRKSELHLYTANLFKKQQERARRGWSNPTVWHLSRDVARRGGWHLQKGGDWQGQHLSTGAAH